MMMFILENQKCFLAPYKVNYSKIITKIKGILRCLESYSFTIIQNAFHVWFEWYQYSHAK
jgi:hypothetical protein